MFYEYLRYLYAFENGAFHLKTLKFQIVLGFAEEVNLNQDENHYLKS
jgi:hypothetical protein